MVRVTRYWIIDTRYWVLGIFLSLVVFSSCTLSDPTETTLPKIEATSSGVLVTPSVVEPQLPTDNTPTAVSSPTPTVIPPTEDVSPPSDQAEVLDVKVSGEAGAYNFSVTVSSPDEGCNQYADWWEVLTPEGELLYRRILLHSHVGEQPFTRSGGPVPIESDVVVLVRAHMNTSGYSDQAMEGSFEDGFKSVTINPDFAADLEETPPLPQGCNF